MQHRPTMIKPSWLLLIAFLLVIFIPIFTLGFFTTSCSLEHAIFEVQIDGNDFEVQLVDSNRVACNDNFFLVQNITLNAAGDKVTLITHSNEKLFLSKVPQNGELTPRLEVENSNGSKIIKYPEP